MSVHAPHQVLLEGLTQAMPMLVTPEDTVLVARVRLAHYTQLVYARLHVAINAGTSVEQCAAEARRLVPFWGDDEIADALADRGANPLLRSYLWSYPVGLDWFAALADAADQDTTRELLHAAYRQPLTPPDGRIPVQVARRPATMIGTPKRSDGTTCRTTRVGVKAGVRGTR
jgi:hypothetical protein